MGPVLHGPSVQGPGILGNRTFTLQAALGARPPNDTHPSCPAPAPFVLKACPGAAPAPVCVPGARSLTGLESGCCACRRTRATVPVSGQRDRSHVAYLDVGMGWQAGPAHCSTARLGPH